MPREHAVPVNSGDNPSKACVSSSSLGSYHKNNEVGAYPTDIDDIPHMLAAARESLG